MRHMINATSEQNGSRMQADREELADRIARGQPRDGRVELRPGLFLNRVSSTTEPVHGVLEPSFCVIAQGSKDILLGGEHFRYDPAHYLITTMGVPAAGQVVEASRDRPYLSVRLVLDPSVVTSVMVESAGAQPLGYRGDVKSVDVSALDSDLLDATLRLVRLVERPGEYFALASLVVREIIFRLLTGAKAADCATSPRSAGKPIGWFAPCRSCAKTLISRSASRPSPGNSA